ncbi:hypothetical protein H6G00_11850 [Leptolyngbya sp. FACHB-541]|uniref:hypothetical protein n=1 Tax=Leptolyngbya sp. FACHB-541 TaxID=2692810 RepID=UPI001683B84C|nr:hypothetical protein [Leptolyngbya sp. FACHB-541]MBD1997313.1 hypothetical protein [Leptolyngbya sp. FACHB-541]
MSEGSVPSLKTLIQPCNSGMCPALYSDEQGRIFVQGKRLSGNNRSTLTVSDCEEVVQITPELIDFLRSQLL